MPSKSPKSQKSTAASKSPTPKSSRVKFSGKVEKSGSKTAQNKEKKPQEKQKWEQKKKQDDEARENERRSRLVCYNGRGPGPANWLLPPVVGFINHDGTKNRAPAFSLGLGRTKRRALIYSSAKYDAGPASYNLQGLIGNVRPSPPAFKFGIRHTKCEGTLFKLLQ